jgi:hypothetical protein
VAETEIIEHSQPRPRSASPGPDRRKPTLEGRDQPTPRSAQTHAQAKIVEQTQAHVETVNYHATTKSTEERGELWRTEKVMKAMENRGRAQRREGKKWKRKKEIRQNEKIIIIK